MITTSLLSPNSKISFEKNCLNSPINSPSFKEKFKAKYRYYIAILCGINMMLIFASRDYAPVFFNLKIFLDEGENNKVLSKIYCISNFFFPIFFGYVTDYIGYHMGLIALHFPLLIGNLFIMMSSLMDPFSMECAMVGRFLFSVGGDALQIILITVVVNYFKRSNQVSFGIGILMSIANLGYSLIKLTQVFEILDIQNNNNKINLFKPSLLGLIFSVFSLILSTFIIIFENYWVNLIKNAQNDINKVNIREINVFERSFLNEREMYPYSFWQSFKKMLTLRVLMVSMMNGMMWGSYYCMVNYNKYFFGVNSQNVLNMQFNQEVLAILLHGTIAFTTIVIVGRYIDRYKQRNFLMMLGCLLNSFSFILFSTAYDNININISNVNTTLLAFFLTMATGSLGLGMGFFSAAVNSSIPFIVKEKNLTIGYGMIFSITNFIQFLLISITPTIAQDQSFSYARNPFWILSCLSLVMAIILEFIERKNGKTAIK